MNSRSLTPVSVLVLSLTAGAFAQSITGFPSVTMKDKRPVIGANYTGLRLRPESAHMVLDGKDITSLSVIGPTIMNFEPSYDLNPGRHNVTFMAVTDNGQNVNNQWSFVIENPKPTLLQILSNSNIPNLSLDQKFPQGSNNPSRPEIGARFRGQLQSVRLLVDGQDVTNSSNRTTNSIIWQPQYDVAPGNHNAQLFATGIHGHQVLDNWNFQVAGFNPTGQALEVTRYWPRPEPNQNPRSKLGADFNENVAWVRLFADGQELTNQCSFSGNGIRWVPTQDLTPGTHRLRVVAHGVSGQDLTRDWKFQVAQPQMHTYAPSYVPPMPNWPQSQNLTTFPSDSGGPRSPIGVMVPNGIMFRQYTLNLDGRDITPYAHAQGANIYYQPDFDLQRGMHQVQFTGWNQAGQRTDRTWVFNVQ